MVAGSGAGISQQIQSVADHVKSLSGYMLLLPETLELAAVLAGQLPSMLESGLQKRLFGSQDIVNNCMQHSCELISAII